MKQDKVTVSDLQGMKVGETRTFELPDARAIENGKVLAYRTGRMSGCRYKASSDFVNSTLTLTKEQLS